jgi:two-component system cell cycle sensor histidine kinase/response regulator CckA
LLGYANVAQDKLESENPVQGMLSAIARAAAQAGSLTSWLLAFSSKQVSQLHISDLSHTVVGMRGHLAPPDGRDVRLELVPQQEPYLLEAGGRQTAQIIENLAGNAREALPAGGSLTIETHFVLLEQEGLGRHHGHPAGRYSLLVVSDNGTGMNAGMRSHIFEPCFTTKGVVNRWGLGLARFTGS